MFKLNIKSKSFMCLDIDPDSVVHTQLVKKLYESTSDSNSDVFDSSNRGYYSKLLWPRTGISYDFLHEGHGLLPLPSFHISLGEPPKALVPDTLDFCYLDIMPIIGDITLAPICVSEAENKKSAWVPLHPLWFDDILPSIIDLTQFDSYDHRCDECPVRHLHVSLANKTGNSHGSIARPEDCIIDTLKP